MKHYVLDTSALLTLRDDETGADRVAELLSLAGGRKVRCLASFMTLMEVFYRVWKDEGEAAGRLAYEQCLALPIEWMHETPEMLEAAAAIKAKHALSLADAWIAACAQLAPGILVHKDSEFEPLLIKMERLPYKPKNRS